MIRSITRHRTQLTEQADRITELEAQLAEAIEDRDLYLAETHRQSELIKEERIERAVCERFLQQELAAVRRPAGTDWTPEGTTVVQRYSTLGGAVVLVYTNRADPQHWAASYAAACLGCTYRTASDASLGEREAADLANKHAAVCRALPKPPPARPDDVDAADMLRRHLRHHRGSTHISPANFHAIRVELQRDDDWIDQELHHIAANDSKALLLDPNGSFTIPRIPARN